MIELDLDLLHPFHLELVSTAWLRRLWEFLSDQERLRGLGMVRSDYSEDRFFGPQSVVKYRFKVDFEDPAPSDSPVWSGHTAEVEYRPRHDNFKLRNLWWRLYWKDEPGDLARTGFAPLTHAPDPEVVRRLEERAARNWTLTPVAMEGSSVVVAVGDPEHVERASDVGWLFQAPVLPRLASRDEVTSILDQVHGALEPYEYFRIAPVKPLAGRASGRPLFGEPPRGLRLEWRHSLATPAIVEVDGTQVFFRRQDWPMSLVRDLEPDLADSLRQLAEDPLIWEVSGEPEGLAHWRVMGGERRGQQWEGNGLPDGPFTRYCLALLQLAFEVELDRETRWI